MIDNHGFTQTKIGELLGVTRAEISRRMINNIGDENWEVYELNSQVEQFIIMMIEDNLYTLESEEISVYLRSNNDEKVIIIAEDGVLSFLYHIPEHLHKMIKEHKMDIYTENEANLIRNTEFIHVMGEKMARPDKQVRSKLRNYAKKIMKQWMK